MWMLSKMWGTKEEIKCYMVICNPRGSSALAIKKYLNGYCNDHMKEYYLKNQIFFNVNYAVYGQLEDAKKNLIDKLMGPNSAYILRLTVPKEEVYEAIKKGKFSEVVKDALDFYEYKTKCVELFITKDPTAQQIPAFTAKSASATVQDMDLDGAIQKLTKDGSFTAKLIGLFQQSGFQITDHRQLAACMMSYATFIYSSELAGEHEVTSQPPPHLGQPSQV